MKRIKNYNSFKTETPATKLTDAANVYPEEVLSEEELQQKEKEPECELPEEQQPEVTGVAIERPPLESLKHISEYREFKV